MGKAKVLLVYPHLHNKEFMFARFPPLGLEYIAGYIRGFADVKILDYRFDKNIRRAIRRFGPDVIGISVLNCVRAHDSYAVAALCRNESDAMIVGGGLHATICPDEALDKGFDVVVRGEGEVTFGELLKADGMKGVKGISFKGKGRVVHKKEAPLVENPDDLPPPARDLRSPAANYSMNRGLMKADLLSTSRGCTGDCNFCSPAVYYRGRWRAHSPEYVMEDLRRIEAPWIVLTDDHFMGNLERVERLCDMIIAEGIEKDFAFQTRMAPEKSGLKKKMVEAGFRVITFGVEGPSQEMVDRYGKGMSLGAIKKFVLEWREAGAVFINGSFVFAHPDDSLEDLLSFGDFARDIGLDFADFIMLTPYPGTQVYKDYDKEGKILTKDWRKYTQGTLLVEHSELSDVEMRNAKRLAFLRFMTPLKVSRMLELIGNYFTRYGGGERRSLTALKGLYIGLMNQHLLFGNHYEASVFEGLPEYGEREMARKEMLMFYFRDHVNGFPEHERDMTAGIRSLVNSTGLKRLLKPAKNLDVSVLFKDGRRTSAHLKIEIRSGEVESAVFDFGAPVSALRIPVDINRLQVMEERSVFYGILDSLSRTVTGT
ncbi:MAG: radical SAM protein [bacterium]